MPGAATDPDLPVRPRRPGPLTIAVVAIGGILGAEARYGLSVALPHPDGSWPWSTLITNIAGCLLIGMLMVVLLDLVRRPHPLVRPFLGVGVLGGFTTFSTFALDADTLLHHHRGGAAAGYVLVSVVGCILAVVAGTSVTRAIGRAA